MYKSRSDGQHSFAQVPSAEIPRSSFDRSHGHKTTFDAAYLVPVFYDEALPGDTFSLNMTTFCRMATPIFPIMDNLKLESFFFAVPLRLIWDNWQRFNGEQDNPDDSTDFLCPIMNSGTGYAEGSIHDYFGLPIFAAGVDHSAFFHRAYNLIWNQWFRDENLQDSVVVNKGDGPDNPVDYTLLRRGKRHDYFSGCLPWPQKGPSVQLPIGDTAPVVTTNQIPFFIGQSGNVSLNSEAAGTNAIFSTVQAQTVPMQFSYQTGLEADLSAATAATINQLRQAFAVQRLYERDARGGSRYTEILRSHFGVISPDQRLQRAEFLGGGSQVINFTQVPQTSGTATGPGGYTPTPQGNLSAFATSQGSGHGFSKSFVEHCVVIGLVCVRADLNYQQGLDRMWSRRTRWDYYWPALSHIGEQSVLKKELMCVGTAGTTDDEVFGYQERWAEYRYKPSKITGRFRSTSVASLDSWHLAQEFSAVPTLSAAFIEENPPVDRVVATPLEPHFLFDSFFQYRCARPMPTYSVPGLIDHF